jgi:hypothetical protein
MMKLPNIEVSQTAFDYLQSLAVPLVDTTITTIDRIVNEHKKFASLSGPANSAGMIFGVTNLPSVRFTSVVSATIAGKPASKNFWNNMLEDMISACVTKGCLVQDIKAVLNVNMQDGQSKNDSFRYVPAAKFSFQGTDAVRACRNIIALATKFEVATNIEVQWQDNPEAELPNQIARLVFP